MRQHSPEWSPSECRERRSGSCSGICGSARTLYRTGWRLRTNTSGMRRADLEELQEAGQSTGSACFENVNTRDELESELKNLRVLQVQGQESGLKGVLEGGLKNQTGLYRNKCSDRGYRAAIAVRQRPTGSSPTSSRFHM